MTVASRTLLKLPAGLAVEKNNLLEMHIHSEVLDEMFAEIDKISKRQPALLKGLKKILEDVRLEFEHDKEEEAMKKRSKEVEKEKASAIAKQFIEQLKKYMPTKEGKYQPVPTKQKPGESLDEYVERRREANANNKNLKAVTPLITAIENGTKKVGKKFYLMYANAINADVPPALLARIDDEYGFDGVLLPKSVLKLL